MADRSVGSGKYHGRLELTWTNKDQALLWSEDGSYRWVAPTDYRVAEVRLLHDAGEVGQPQAWFDSSTELAAANIIDGAPEVDFWVRLERNDCPILWAGMKTYYNPDFIVVEKTGTHHMVEIKMEKEGSTPAVAGKAEAALRWVNHVNADPKTGAKWAYLLVLESDVEAAKGSWSALKSLNRT